MTMFARHPPRDLLAAPLELQRGHWLARGLVWAPRPFLGGGMVDPASGAVCTALGNATVDIADDHSAIATSYDGAGDAWDTPSPANPATTSRYTIACWSVMTTFSNGELFNIETSDALILSHRSSDSAMRLFHKDTGGTYQGTDYSTAWSVGVAAHWCATYDGANQRLYKNGAQFGSRATTGGVFSTANDWRQGLHSGGSANPMNGRIWRAYGWDRALDAAEVAALYEGADLDLWQRRRRLYLIPKAAATPAGTILPQMMAMH